MHLTRFTDNALRCLLYLGDAPGDVATIPEIARAMAMSADHLTKVVQRLAQRGYVETTRGRGGGVRLTRSLDTITLGAVVRDTEDELSLVPCFVSAAHCPASPTCGLPAVLDEALAAFFAVLDRQTLADIAASKQLRVRLQRSHR